MSAVQEKSFAIPNFRFPKKTNQELDFLDEIHQLGDGFRVLLQNPKYPFQNLIYIQISQLNALKI